MTIKNDSLSNLHSKLKIHKSNTQRYKCFSSKRHINLKGELYFVSDEHKFLEVGGRSVKKYRIKRFNRI